MSRRSSSLSAHWSIWNFQAKSSRNCAHVTACMAFTTLFLYFIFHFSSSPHRSSSSADTNVTRASQALEPCFIYIYILFYIFVSVFIIDFSFAFIFSRFSCRVFVCHGFFYCFSLPLLAGCAICKSETRMVSTVLSEGRGQSTAHKSGWNYFTSHSPRSQSRTFRLSRKTHTLSRVHNKWGTERNWDVSI